MKVLLTRQNYTDKQTTGFMQILNDKDECIFTCMTLELSWKENKVGLSCIPTGTYNCVRCQSPKRGIYYSVENVHGRSCILVHTGNYYSQIAGCILIGRTLKKINSDDELDLTESIPTLNVFQSIIGRSFTLVIE